MSGQICPTRNQLLKMDYSPELVFVISEVAKAIIACICHISCGISYVSVKAKAGKTKEFLHVHVMIC